MEFATAQNLLSLPKTYYPLFDFCHIVLCVLTIRKETGKGFGHEHPLAAWTACMVSSFAGSLLANPLLGKPMFGAFSDEHLVLMATIVFLAVFFSPGDIAYKVLTTTPVYATICVLKEVYRAKKIYAGLQDGQKAFPDSRYLIPVIVAVLKGNGSAFMTPFARAIRGEWKPAATEIMSPSVTTKECFLAAVVFAYFSPSLPDAVFLALVGLFVSVKLGAVMGSPVDPFSPVEAAVFGVVEAVSPKPEKQVKAKEN